MHDEHILIQMKKSAENLCILSVLCAVNPSILRMIKEIESVKSTVVKIRFSS